MRYFKENGSLIFMKFLFIIRNLQKIIKKHYKILVTKLSIVY